MLNLAINVNLLNEFAIAVVVIVVAIQLLILKVIYEMRNRLMEWKGEKISIYLILIISHIPNKMDKYLKFDAENKSYIKIGNKLLVLYRFLVTIIVLTVLTALTMFVTYTTRS